MNNSLKKARSRDYEGGQIRLGTSPRFENPDPKPKIKIPKPQALNPKP